MKTSFILRFQERCEASILGSIGTATMTRVAQEQPDADPGGSGIKALLDIDPEFDAMQDSRRIMPIHPVMLTMTKTAVRLESDDRDPNQREMTAFPRCSSY